MTEFLKKITKADIRNILAVITVLGLFVVIIIMTMKPIPSANKDTLNIILGTLLGGLVGGVAGFYFGASKPKEDKNESDS